MTIKAITARMAIGIGMALLFIGGAFAADTVYLRDPTRANYCKIVGTSNSGAALQITCDATYSGGFSVGDVLIIYNVLGNDIANGIRKVSAVSGANYTLTKVDGTAITSSGNWVDPRIYGSDNYKPFSYGGASPAKLYTLKDHPRTILDGPGGTLTTALSNTSGRANPTGVQKVAIDSSYTNSVGSYQSWTNCNNWECATFANAAVKHWIENVVGASGNSTLQTYATWLMSNNGSGQYNGNIIFFNNMACDETVAYCGTPQQGNAIVMDFTNLQIPSFVANYEFVYSTLTSAQRQTWVNFWLNDNSEGHDGFGLHNAPGSDCTKPNSTSYIWQDDGHCGGLWILKHANYSGMSDPTWYPTGGGSVWDISNLGGWTIFQARTLLGISLCGSDGGDPTVDRGCRLASQASAYQWDHMFSEAIGNWGIGHAQNSYSRTRPSRGFGEYIALHKNSVVGFPDVTNSISDNLTLEDTYLMHPYAPTIESQWGEGGGVDIGLGYVGGYRSPFLSMWASPTYAPYEFYNIQNSQGYWLNTGVGASNQRNYLWWAYIFVDPTITPTNINTLPKQRFFHAQNSALCTSLHLNCSMYDAPMQHVSSKTGWGTSDTFLHVINFGQTYDGHSTNFPCPGCVRVYKNTGLLAGNTTGASGYSSIWGDEFDNVVEIGGTYQKFAGSVGPCLLENSTPHITKWAGTDPTGDDRYVALTIDLKGAYCASASVTRANKNIVHLKGGSQDYVIAYFDGATSSATQWREYVHYRVQGDQGTPTYSPGITLSRASRTITDADTTSSAGITSKFLAVNGNTNSIYVGDQNNSDTNLSFTGSQGGSGRIEVGTSTDGSTLATSTTAEWAYVHKPCASATCTMPAIVQPSCSGSGGPCAVVEIQDATSPKVAMFVRQAASLVGASFTTSHIGTAQYVISGMPAGTYTVTKNGTAISGSPFSVSSGDGTIYFESTNGAFVVGSGPCTNSPTVTLTSPVTGTYTSIPINVSASASSNCGLNTISSLVVDDGLGNNICTSATGSCSSLWNAANGTYTVTATASDSGGNIGTASRSGVVVNTVVLPAGSVGRGKHICNGKCVMK